MEKKCEYKPRERFFLYVFVITTMLHTCDISQDQGKIIEMLETITVETPVTEGE